MKKQKNRYKLTNISVTNVKKLWANLIKQNLSHLVFKPRGRFFDKKFRLLIEDFFAKTDVEQQTQIDELLIGTSLATETNGNSLNFYSTAFDNLINIVPKLETLTIDGGYVLKPAFGVFILQNQ